MGITEDVLAQVAEAEECDPLELPPLYDSIDASAIERCVASANAPVTIRFTYCSYAVTVQGGDEATVEVDGSHDPRNDDPVR